MNRAAIAGSPDLAGVCTPTSCSFQTSERGQPVAEISEYKVFPGQILIVVSPK